MNKIDKQNTKPFYNTIIPGDWVVKPVGKAFEICNNLRFPISEEERKKIQGEFPYYGPTKIQDYINEYRLDGKYALIGEDGDHFLKWRVLPMTLLVNGKFNVNNHAHIIQGKDNLTEWFFYFFNNKELTPYLTRQGAGRYKLTKDSLQKILCPLPSINEQKAIVKVISTIDEVINKNNQLIAQKDLRKKWLMQNLLTGKKRLKGFCGEWKEYHLGEMFKERNETKYFDLPLLSVGASGIYPQSDSIKKDTSNDDKSKYKRICPGDIGYNTMRMWQGRSALSSLEGIVSPAYTIVSPNKNADSLYFSYLFKMPKLMNLFWRNSQGLVDDTLNCKFKDFAIVRISLPEMKEEQTAIAQVLQAADKEIQLLKAKTDKLREQKQGMMQVLLTGKKRLKV
ncbi:MAG: restriction endonuclease subunit S [Prolixibacteraceae bacterium]|jgi:type I restriction enzyme S subunit|nr:restriction endonuclease subunit S [Prolixibacteraceae bacterium]